MKDRGFILVVVLWAIALLALTAAVFSRAVQGQVREAGASARSAEAQAMADAGVNLAAYDFILNPGNATARRRIPVDGSLFACRLADRGLLHISVQDIAGRINVNLAEPQLIAALLVGLGAEPDAALRLADRIADFRDADDEARPLGAERQLYSEAGLARGPKNAPLDSLLELQQVIGMDAATVTAITPYVTLHSGSGKLDPAATSATLAALISSGLSKIPFAGDVSLFDAKIPAAFSAPSDGRKYAVSVVALSDAGGRFARDAVFDITSLTRPRPRFLSWSKGIDVPQAPSVRPGDPGVPPC